VLRVGILSVGRTLVSVISSTNLRCGIIGDFLAAEVLDIASIHDIAAYALDGEPFPGHLMGSSISIILFVAGEHDLRAALCQTACDAKAHPGHRAREAATLSDRSKPLCTIFLLVSYAG